MEGACQIIPFCLRLIGIGLKSVPFIKIDRLYLYEFRIVDPWYGLKPIFVMHCAIRHNTGVTWAKIAMHDSILNIRPTSVCYVKKQIAQ